MKQKTIYALGFFDGVHLGHQALLAECCQMAGSQNAVSAAVTFRLPPSAVLQKQPPNMINTAADRVTLLKQFGMGQVSVYETDETTFSTPWQAFLQDLLNLGAVGFVCGSDFRFGRGGEGNAELLQDFCRERGLPCVVVPEQRMDGSRISSTRIRQLLEQGEVAQANRFLGHRHILSGKVVSGHQLGRTIGIPTANLLLPAELLAPKFGVYACKATVEGKEYMAVTNIGTRPTVDGKGVTVESYLLDFDGELYGKYVTIAFYDFLRPEQKFDSIDALKRQIANDITQVRTILQ